MNVSEYTPRLHVQILTSPAAAVHFKRTDGQAVTEPAAAVNELRRLNILTLAD